ncbi:MAG: imidazole glycerol phosphate synthase subunit HisF [bacterium]
MLTKRIIPCLDIKDGLTVKGVNFKNLRSAGDAIELAKRYVVEGADELVFLDITATIEKRATLIALVEKIAAEINIPFTVGGGINSVQDVSALLNAGADKVSINSAAVQSPQLIKQLALEFGSQCIVVAIDAKNVGNQWQVFIHAGKKATGRDAISWAQQAQEQGAGEILLTSMNHDGTKSGFAIDITHTISESLSIPVIASGGAGKMAHFVDIFERGKADAALAASIFHFGEIKIPDLKRFLANQNIPMRA